MNIDYRIGDMFKGGHLYIAHGCNAQGVMGSGVAYLVHRDYNYAFSAYKRKYDTEGLQLGEVVAADSALLGEPTIFNCITQDHFGTDQRYANYGAIQKCIQRIDAYMETRRVSHWVSHEVAFPMIGAGLAGGDWQIIERIIERNAKNFQPIVYDFTP